MAAHAHAAHAPNRCCYQACGFPTNLSCSLCCCDHSPQADSHGCNMHWFEHGLLDIRMACIAKLAGEAGQYSRMKRRLVGRRASTVLNVIYSEEVLFLNSFLVAARPPCLQSCSAPPGSRSRHPYRWSLAHPEWPVLHAKSAQPSAGHASTQHLQATRKRAPELAACQNCSRTCIVST